jgi:hypothetical protein
VPERWHFPYSQATREKVQNEDEILKEEHQVIGTIPKNCVVLETT